MKEVDYNRQKAVDYAKQWAYDRNPKYYNYDKLGGDCTNYISQCIHAGSNIMNYTKEYGWYYIDANTKTPSWTGVPFLYQFLVTNKSVGPYGREVGIEEVEVGDIVQLSFADNKYTHTMIIVEKEMGKIEDISQIKIASHTIDNFGKSISEYQYENIRWIHIDGIRKW